MNKLITTTPQGSLAERVRAKLGDPTPMSGAGATTQHKALLLDISGSMNELCEDGREKIDALKELARELVQPGLSVRAFADHLSGEISGGGGIERLSAQGQTMLGAALAGVRGGGIRHVILITDGLPSDAARALREVRGLRLDIFYVGPPPRPAFLDELARAALAGSSSQAATLAKGARPQLKAKIRGLLNP